MRVEQGWGLPEQRFERPPSPGLGRLVVEFGRGLCHASPRQQHAGKRRGQPEAEHSAHEDPPGQLARLYRRDQVAQFTFRHGFSFAAARPRRAKTSEKIPFSAPSRPDLSDTP